MWGIPSLFRTDRDAATKGLFLETKKVKTSTGYGMHRSWCRLAAND